MSPLVTRPSLPEPGTVAASMPLSAEIRRTEGASGASDGRPFCGAARAAAGGGGEGGEGRRAGAPGLAGRPRGLGSGSGRAVIDLPEQPADRDGFAVLGGD